MLRVKKSMGEIFPYQSEYFPHAENLEPFLFFCSAALVDKVIRGNIIHNLLYQLVVNMGKYLPQKGKARGKKKLLKTLWEKKKMLVTSIFSFSHIVFYSIKDRNDHLCYIYFVVCKCFQFGQGQNFVNW